MQVHAMREANVTIVERAVDRQSVVSVFPIFHRGTVPLDFFCLSNIGTYPYRFLRPALISYPCRCRPMCVRICLAILRLSGVFFLGADPLGRCLSVVPVGSNSVTAYSNHVLRSRCFFVCQVLSYI